MSGESIDPAAREPTSLEGETFGYDLAVLVPPHTGADVVVKSGLTLVGGWVPVDRNTLRVEGQENIFAIGDCTNLLISKSGSTAPFEAPVVVEQIVPPSRGVRPAPPRRATAAR